MIKTTLTVLLAFCHFLEPAWQQSLNTSKNLCHMALDEWRVASKCPPFLYELEVPKPPKTSPFVVPNIVEAA